MLKHIKPALRPGQILVDTTVPLAASVGGRPTRSLGVWQGSAAEQAAELAPEGISVVAAFHNVSAELLHHDGPVDCDVIVCSDDKVAAQRIRVLARKIPGRPHCRWQQTGERAHRGADYGPTDRIQCPL